VEEAVTADDFKATTFNSPLEAGFRAVSILAAAAPQVFDLQRLVTLDYLLVHSGDIGGPASLHPDLPMRSGELLVRRKLVESGLLLMVSRNLVIRHIDKSGIGYSAHDMADIFLDSLTSGYTTEMRSRAKWLAEEFSAASDVEFQRRANTVIERWAEQFQQVHTSLGF
jgi:hypothetical protein